MELAAVPRNQGRPPRWAQHTLVTIQRLCCCLSACALWKPYPRHSFVQFIQLINLLTACTGLGTGWALEPWEADRHSTPKPRVIHVIHVCHTR